MIKKLLLLAVLLLSFSSTSLCAQESQEEKSYDSTARDYFLSLFDTTMMEIVVVSYNMAITHEDYAMISLESMKNNLMSAWWWDMDEFYINQLYHPYQGSMYFITGRANGLGFWESFIPNVYGTLMWEYFMEIDTPAVNDFITTSITGPFVGEMFHRTYKLLDKNFMPLAILISPFDALCELINGKSAPQPDVSFYELNVSTGYSFLSSNLYLQNNPLYNYSAYPNSTYDYKAYNNSSNFNGTLNFNYGKRFGHDTKEPFDVFSFQAKTIDSTSLYYYSFLTDGFIWSKALNISGDATFSLLYNFDYVMSCNINYSNSSIGCGFDYRPYLSQDESSSFSFGTSWSLSINGASEFFHLHNTYIRGDSEHNKQRLYSLGFGLNEKSYLKYDDPLIGTFYVNHFFSLFYNPKFTVSTLGSTGWDLICYLEAGYEHKIYKNIYLGISDLFYYKKGFYNTAENVTHSMNFINLYVGYRF